MNIKSYLRHKKKIIDNALDLYLPLAKSSTVARAMCYSIFAGGKRFRPILCLAACEVVGGNPKAALPAACALEMIHTYSLIHDDLPCMDDDDFRRGKPTSHKVFGQAMAILAGDALCALAFEVVVKFADKRIPAERVLQVVAELSTAMGQGGMVGGQVRDLEAENKKISFRDLELIHTQKTGALIEAAIRCGAILGGAAESKIKALTRYAQHLGMSFQIRDDILDVEGSLSALGKTPGSDQRKQKATYPKLLDLSRSRNLAEHHSRLALKALQTFGRRAEPLRKIVGFLDKRKG